jgi:hypothetical protein
VQTFFSRFAAGSPSTRIAFNKDREHDPCTLCSSLFVRKREKLLKIRFIVNIVNRNRGRLQPERSKKLVFAHERLIRKNKRVNYEHAVLSGTMVRVLDTPMERLEFTNAILEELN